VFGQPFVAKEQIAGLSPSRTAEGTLLAASSLFFAVPYDGPGGRLAVLPAAFAGRLPEGFAMVETGSTVADFCFASFHPSLLVTGQENGVLLWQLPESGLPLVKNGSNLRAETAKLVGHRRRVTSVVSNPAVEGVLASLSAPCGELKANKQRSYLQGD
jgi:coronin-7